MLLFACTNYEKDNERLNEEVKGVREENSYLKAEIVGLQRQLAEMNTKVKEERESLQKKFEEERDEMHKKVQEEREAMQKRSQEAAKKSMAAHKESKDTGSPKNPKDASAPKTGQAHGNDNKTQKNPPAEQN
jgi:predicted  nucleic acid-binding Zn-ribbon protein